MPLHPARQRGTALCPGMPLPRLPILLCLTMGLSTSFGQNPVVKGFYHDQCLTFTLNPLGGLVTSQLFYRTPLVARPGILWETTKLETGIQNDFCPAFDMVGLFLRVEPIAFFRLTLYGAGVEVFKAFGFGLQRLPGPDAPYSTKALKNVRQENRGGYWLSAAPALQAAAGPIVGRAALTCTYVNYGKEDWYYVEPYWTLPMRAHDMEYVGDAMVAYELKGGFYPGLAYNLTAVGSSGYRADRVLAMCAIDRKTRRGTAWYATALVGVWLRHRHFARQPCLAVSLGVTPRLGGRGHVGAGKP